MPRPRRRLLHRPHNHGRRGQHAEQEYGNGQAMYMKPLARKVGRDSAGDTSDDEEGDEGDWDTVGGRLVVEMED